jgi:flagellar FliJ protein
MAFQFRFETLMQVRRRQRDEAAVALGQAGAAIERIASQIADIATKRQSIREWSAGQRTGEIFVDDLLTQGRYDLQLEAEALALDQTLNELNEEEKRRRQVLVHAEAEVKRFERLLENDRAKYQALQRRREQFEADDATGRQYTIQLQRNHDDF